MRTAVSDLAVATPRDQRHALALLADAARSGDPLTPLAGGTDLLVALNAGVLSERRFLDVWPLRSNGAAQIRVIANGVSIGGLTTFTEIHRTPLTARWPMLRAAAREVGGWQIQNRATIAGNVANASPAGDSLPALLAMGAAIHLASTSGTRVVPFAEFYSAYRETVRRPDELITTIEAHDPPAGAVQFFRKVGTRRAQAISKVVMAGLLDRDEDGRVRLVRIGIGSVADRPIRASHAEATLTGRVLTSGTIADAVRAIDDDVRPIDDIRSTERYRRTIAANVLRQFLDSTAAR